MLIDNNMGKTFTCQHIPCLDLLPRKAAHHYLTD